MPVQLNQDLWGGTQAQMLSQRLLVLTCGQGWGALGYRFRPTEPSPLSDVQDRPLVLAMRLGWGGSRLEGSEEELRVQLGQQTLHRWDN